MNLLINVDRSSKIIQKASDFYLNYKSLVNIQHLNFEKISKIVQNHTILQFVTNFSTIDTLLSLHSNLIQSY